MSTANVNSENNISNSDKSGNSVVTDSNGRELSLEQQERYKDIRLVIRHDSNGKKYLYDIDKIKKESSNHLTQSAINRLANSHKNGKLDNSIYKLSRTNSSVNTENTKSSKTVDTKGNEDYVLPSGLVDDEYFIPVEFNIKEYTPESKTKNKIYVTVALGEIKIETGVMGTLTSNNNDDASGSRPISNFKLPYIVKNVNAENKIYVILRMLTHLLIVSIMVLI